MKYVDGITLDFQCWLLKNLWSFEMEVFLRWIFYNVDLENFTIFWGWIWWCFHCWSRKYTMLAYKSLQCLYFEVQLWCGFDYEVERFIVSFRKVTKVRIWCLLMMWLWKFSIMTYQSLQCSYLEVSQSRMFYDVDLVSFHCFYWEVCWCLVLTLK